LTAELASAGPAVREPLRVCGRHQHVFLCGQLGGIRGVRRPRRASAWSCVRARARSRPRRPKGREAGVRGAAPHPVTRSACGRMRPQRQHSNALEWTRTTTGKTPHKALNLDQARHICPPASRSWVLSRFADASHASDELTFVKHLSRHRRREATNVHTHGRLARRAGPKEVSARKGRLMSLEGGRHEQRRSCGDRGDRRLPLPASASAPRCCRGRTGEPGLSASGRTTRSASD
jgi:hypothetical protein